MGTFSIGGLSTGLDTQGIIDQLLSIDARPKVKLEWNKALWDARKSGWSDLNGRLNLLQSFANAITSPGTWASFSGINSSDATRVAGVAGLAPAAGEYEIEVSQLAATETWSAASGLPGATSGVRRTGVWYEGTNNPMEATDALTLTKRGNSGTSAGINNNSTITLDWLEDGEHHASTYLVTPGRTLQNLMDWVETQIPGSTTTRNADGSWDVTSAPGTASEITGLNFTARNAAGTVLNNFNGSPHAMSSMTTAASSGGAPVPDTLAITQGSQTWYINVAQGDNVFDIVNAINSTAGIGVTATQNAGLLALAANESGAGKSFTVSSAAGLATTLGLSEVAAGVDSAFTVNGTAYARSINAGIDDVIGGVSFDLLNLTAPGAPVTLSVGTPASTVADQKKKIIDFVNQYNEVIDFVNAKSGEKKVANPRNLGEYLQGPLSRDYRFSAIGFDLRKQVGDIVQGLPLGQDTLASIGITTGAIGTSGNTTGKLVIDEAKLEQALNSDPQNVRDLMAKVGGGPPSEDGIARRISSMVSQWRTGGAVDAALDGAGAQVDSLQESIDRFSDRLERKRTYYERIFARLETNVGRIQSQNSWLSGQFASMSSG